MITPLQTPGIKSPTKANFSLPPKVTSSCDYLMLKVLNEVHYANVFHMPYDKIGNMTYFFCLNVVNVALRFKASVPIGSTSINNWKEILTSHTITRAFIEFYDDSLTWKNY
ncbi:3768_t:CDS:2 [Rhizophagus irregularis]|nr:3768_t:CDS:2 [Rhizophagus irregularis]